MPFKNKENYNAYMRRYRATMKAFRGFAEKIAFESNLWLRSEIIALIREKHPYFSNEDLHGIVDAVYELIKSRCPYNKPQEQELIVNVHLLYYYRVDLLPAINTGKKHPSLAPDLSLAIEKFEQEVKQK